MVLINLKLISLDIFFQCHLCTNHFEIKTDPANLDYEIVSGARRQEKRFEAGENGTVVPDEKATINKLATDAMFKLEHGEKDVSKAEDSKPRISKMIQIQDRVKDDYIANRILRDQMRAPRKKAKEQAVKDSALLQKSSLNIKLLPETASDIQMASLLQLNSSMTSEETEAKMREEIIDESVFDKSSSSGLGQGPSSSKKAKMMQHMEKIVKKKKQNDVDASILPTRNSKSIGVILKKDASVSASSTRQPQTTSLDKAKPPGLSLLSADYASSSSNDELD